MNTQVKRSIIAYACAAPAQEVCGFVYQDEGGVHVYPCTNVTQDEEGSARAFEISNEEYVAAAQLGRICAIYHSHSLGGSPEFSEGDLDLAKEMGLPIYLYVVDTQRWLSYVPPTYVLNPIGQIWHWGTQDCYETVRTHYRQQKGVYLGDYDRDETFEGAAFSAITQYVTAEGFTPVSDPSLMRADDVLLFQTLGGAYPHHLGVYLGEQMVLHHPLGGLSRRDPLDGKWLKRVHQVLRYTGQLGTSVIS